MTPSPRHTPPGMKHLHRVYAGPCSVLWLLFLLLSCKPDFQKLASGDVPPEAAKRVGYVVLQPTTDPRPVRASGRLAAQTERRHSFKVSGIIASVEVDEGSSVQAGQVLARLELDEMKARLAKARQALQQARQDQQRVRRLYWDSAATEEQLERTETAVELARNDLRMARYNTQHATIRAQADGRVLKRYAESGEWVRTGQPILKVSERGRQHPIVRVHVSGRHRVRLRPGDSAVVTFDAFPDKVYSAQLTELAEAADPRTGTFELEMTLDRAYPALKNGLQAQVRMIPRPGEPYLRVPMIALQEGSDRQAWIMTPRQGIAQRVRVKPQSMGATYFTISADGPDTVLTSGAAYLQEGDSIELIGGPGDAKIDS